MKKLLVSVMAVLATSGLVMGASFSVPAVTEVADGNSVAIQISGVGSQTAEGVVLFMEIGLPLEIQSFSFDAGTIFDGNHNAPAPNDIMGNLANVSVTTLSGAVQLPGTVAIMTVNVPAGTAAGDYVVRTYIPDFGADSQFVGGTATSDGQGEGIIRVVPEPATALLLLGAVPFLRRRHS